MDLYPADLYLSTTTTTDTLSYILREVSHQNRVDTLPFQRLN